jgi:hypothetical protein
VLAKGSVSVAFHPALDHSVVIHYRDRTASAFLCSVRIIFDLYARRRVDPLQVLSRRIFRAAATFVPHAPWTLFYRPTMQGITRGLEEFGATEADILAALAQQRQDPIKDDDEEATAEAALEAEQQQREQELQQQDSQQPFLHRLFVGWVGAGLGAWRLGVAMGKLCVVASALFQVLGSILSWLLLLATLSLY